MFRELIERDATVQVPTRQLLGIYRRKRLEQAIAMARNLRDGTVDRDALIAQFYCERAQEAIEADDATLARQVLRQARRYDPRNPRARLLEGDLAWNEEEWARASDHYRAACDLDPDCVLQVLDRLGQCHQRLHDRSGLENWLDELLERSPMTTTAAGTGPIAICQ